MSTNDLPRLALARKAQIFFVPVFIILFSLSHAQLRAQQRAQQSAEDEINMSSISGTVENPIRHFRLRNPLKLEKKDAARIYANVKAALRLSYSDSGHEIAKQYQSWQLVNNAPYLSTSHGNHYLNNYANEKAHAYTEYEQAGVLPQGAVIAKDSFSVTETREIILGALFIMEKMGPGFNHVTGDWKYIQIQPDGFILGETNGKNADRVEYCILCHLARRQYDHLYFIPAEYR